MARMWLQVEVDAPTPEQVRAYLMGRGWRPAKVLGMVGENGLTIPMWQEFESHFDVTIDVPLRGDAWDYGPAVGALVKDLAEYEGRTCFGLAQEILGVSL